MSDYQHPISRWSDQLAGALLSTIPDDELRTLLSPSADDLSRPSHRSLLECRNELIERARQCEELRVRVMRAWRESNSDVILAAEQISIDGPPEQLEALLRQFDPQRLLLELITDEHDDGWELARWVVDNINHESRRKEFTGILDEWSAAADENERTQPLQASGRAVIFGGHTRDPQKLLQRLLENTELDIRWKTCDKNQGAPDEKTIREWLAYADATIVITSMVSHNVMKSVRQHAQKNNIPFRAVEKASEPQLLAVLAELFSGR